MTMAPDDEKTTVQKPEDAANEKPAKKGLNKLFLFGKCLKNYVQRRLCQNGMRQGGKPNYRH